MNKTRPRIWLDILILAAAVGIGCFLVLLLPRWLPDTVIVAPDNPAHKPETVYLTEVQQGRLPGYEQAPANETTDYFWYLFNSAVTYADSTAPGNVMLENTAGNICDMVVTYTLASGEEIYRSPMLHPGEYLEYGCLTKAQERGTYPVTVTILVYSAAKTEDKVEDVQQGDESESASEATVPETDEPFATYTEKATLTIG